MIEEKAQKCILEKKIQEFSIKLETFEKGQKKDEIIPHSINISKSEENVQNFDTISKKVKIEDTSIKNNKSVSNTLFLKSVSADEQLSMAKMEAELMLLRKDAQHMKRYIFSLQGEVYGARLAAKYLDKELAGRLKLEIFKIILVKSP